MPIHPDRSHRPYVPFLTLDERAKQGCSLQPPDMSSHLRMTSRRHLSSTRSLQYCPLQQAGSIIGAPATVPVSMGLATTAAANAMTPGTTCHMTSPMTGVSSPSDCPHIRMSDTFVQSPSPRVAAANTTPPPLTAHSYPSNQSLDGDLTPFRTSPPQRSC